MTWPIAFLCCFTILVGAVFAFFLIVYLKEFDREERLLTQKNKEFDLIPIVLINDPIKPKKLEAPKTITPPSLPPKNKKDVN